MNITLNNLDEDYRNLLNDVIKFSTILGVFNVLLFLNNPGKNKLLNTNYLKFLIFLILGLMTYWLVIINIIEIN
tara:strand:+ start:144 stop:365 length:222 start_codon:yes stop_codon:yes gene_type:complete